MQFVLTAISMASSHNNKLAYYTYVMIIFFSKKFAENKCLHALVNRNELQFFSSELTKSSKT